MRMALIVAPLILALSGGALAQGSTYTVDDVVSHFKRKNLGAPRSLCIGTPTECNMQREAQQAPISPFNMQVQFEFGSATLTFEAQRRLDVFAEAATGELRAERFDIDGHTDSVGPANANQRLSEARAQSVVNYLVRRGVDPRRLRSTGYGESSPKHPDGTNGANRRVEASLADN
ncbi:MAG: OmpA family protein [Pseudomonadota bacterium]